MSCHGTIAKAAETAGQIFPVLASISQALCHCSSQLTGRQDDRASDQSQADEDLEGKAGHE